MDKLKQFFAWFLEGSQILLLVASVCLVLYIFVAQPYEVVGNSMVPTFESGEWVLSSLLDARFDHLKRGDVIVFIPPTDPEKRYIKRIIGMPGDKVRLSQGAVYLNGELYDESSYLHLQPNIQTYGENFLHDNVEVTVPDRSFFVMGDNRLYSSDSRDFGFVSRDKIIGKSLIRIWPLNTFLIIRNPLKTS